MYNTLEVKIEYKDGSKGSIVDVLPYDIRTSLCGKYLVVDGEHTHVIELKYVDNWQARPYSTDTTHMTIDEYNKTFGGNFYEIYINGI